MDKNSARDTCLHEVGRAKSQGNALAQPHRGRSQEAESRLAGGSPRVIEPLPDRTQNEVSFRPSAPMQWRCVAALERSMQKERPQMRSHC